MINTFHNFVALSMICVCRIEISKWVFNVIIDKGNNLLEFEIVKSTQFAINSKKIHKQDSANKKLILNFLWLIYTVLQTENFK